MSFTRIDGKSEASNVNSEIAPPLQEHAEDEVIMVDASTSTEEDFADEYEDPNSETDLQAEAKEEVTYFSDIIPIDMEYMLENEVAFGKLFDYFQETKNVFQLMKTCMSPLESPQEKHSDEPVESAELLSGMQLVLKQTYEAIKPDHERMRQFANDVSLDEGYHFEYVQACQSASRISYRLINMFNKFYILMAAHKDKIMLETAEVLDIPELTKEVGSSIFKNHLGDVYEECLKFAEKVKVDLIKVKQKFDAVIENQNENHQEKTSVATDEADEESLYVENISNRDQSESHSETSSVNGDTASQDGVVTCTAEFDGLGQVTVDVSPSKREISAISFLLDEIKNCPNELQQSLAKAKEDGKPFEESIYRLAGAPHSMFHVSPRRAGTSLHRFSLLDMDGFTDNEQAVENHNEGIEAVRNLNNSSVSPRSDKSASSEDEDKYDMRRLTYF